MYLKYLALEGFKSFPERNGLELNPGTCVLVGANGTGKSNLTEAVSWVLGQSDTSSLRVHDSADLVFAGSEELLPMAQAEVTVVLDARPQRVKEEALPASACKHGHAAEHAVDLPEGALTVTRRATTDGDDRFFIDGAAASPDEVRAALRAAGVGSPPVTVIRQGELERLLLLDPRERRRAIEEAAGIPHLSRRRAGLAAHRDSLALHRERLVGERAQESKQVQRIKGEAQTLVAAQTQEVHIAKLRATAVRRALAAAPVGAAAADRLLDMLGLPTDTHTEATPADVPASIARHQLLLTALGPVNRRAEADLRAAAARLAAAAGHIADADRELDEVTASLTALEAEMNAQFTDVHTRIERRFRSYYALLAPGGEAALPLVPTEDGTNSGVDVIARPPGKVLDRVNVLSGGERSLASLSLALALFQEYASPFFVLDEVEPALDDTNIRRLQSVLDLVADDRQILMVSHQQRAKETGDVVFGVERNLDGASQVKFRYEPRTRRLDIFRRTWAADHLRRHPQEHAAEAPGLAAEAPRGRSLGLAGSPTQAALMEFAADLSGAPAGGPGAGPSRHGRLRRFNDFHADGTFRGIWDAYGDGGEITPPCADTDAPDAEGRTDPPDPAADALTEPGPCC